MNKFAPLTPQEISSAATISDDAPDNDTGICIMPVPHDAPPLPQTHRTPGQPSMRWSYRSIEKAFDIELVHALACDCTLQE